MGTHNDCKTLRPVIVLALGVTLDEYLSSTPRMRRRQFAAVDHSRP
jgi:hypothetical protein